VGTAGSQQDKVLHESRTRGRSAASREGTVAADHLLVVLLPLLGKAEELTDQHPCCGTIKDIH
jgi:hypothetical protein